MPTLSEYTNVYNSALQLLRKKGFQVWIDKPAQLFCAERDGWDFMAESPVGLLGLIAMYEHLEPTEYKEYWWRSEVDGSLAYHELPEEPEPYQSVLSGRVSPPDNP